MKAVAVLADDALEQALLVQTDKAHVRGCRDGPGGAGHTAGSRTLLAVRTQLPRPRPWVGGGD